MLSSNKDVTETNKKLAPQVILSVSPYIQLYPKPESKQTSSVSSLRNSIEIISESKCHSSLRRNNKNHENARTNGTNMQQSTELSIDRHDYVNYSSKTFNEYKVSNKQVNLTINNLSIDNIIDKSDIQLNHEKKNGVPKISISNGDIHIIENPIYCHGTSVAKFSISNGDINTIDNSINVHGSTSSSKSFLKENNDELLQESSTASVLTDEAPKPYSSADQAENINIGIKMS